jgi:hypothetical protein
MDPNDPTGDPQPEDPSPGRTDDASPHRPLPHAAPPPPHHAPAAVPPHEAPPAAVPPHDAPPAVPPHEAPPADAPPTRPARFGLVVALLIVVASLAGAGVAWSASVASTRASDLDQLAQQQFLEVQQILTSGRADVGEELRRVGTFQQEIQAERFFEQQSAALAERFPGLSAQLASEAQGQAALARNTGALFFAAFPQVAADGTVTYDREQALNNLLSQYVVYQQLHPEEIQADAATAHTKATRIVGVGFVLAAALFFLTLAQVARTGSRGAFLVVGALVLASGLALWGLVAL